MFKKFDQPPREFDPETERALGAFRDKIKETVPPPSLEGDPLFDWEAQRKHEEKYELAKQRFQILFGDKAQVTPEELSVLVENKVITAKDLQNFKDFELIAEKDIAWLVENDFLYYDKNNELAVVEVLDEEYLKANATALPVQSPRPAPLSHQRYFTDEGLVISRTKEDSLNLHDKNTAPPKHLHVQKPK